MFNSAVLDVAIGMIFVFLIVSFGVTSGNELLASLLKWRAQDLAQGVRVLLGGKQDKIARSLTKKIYDHPLIRSLHRDHGPAENDKLKPSYIPADLFATALLDIALRPADETGKLAVKSLDEARAAIESNRKVLGDQVTRALLTLVDKAEHRGERALTNLEALQGSVAGWFNSSMDRVAGWYKRRTQLVSVVISLLIVGFANVDSIRIARVLSNNQVLRAALIDEATKFHAGAGRGPEGGAPAPAASGAAAASPGASAAAAQDPKAGAEPDPRGESQAKLLKLQADIDKITDLGIPLGWASEVSIPSPAGKGGATWWIHKVFGLFLTALAASLGAPFWFDLLRKLLSLRGGKAAEPPARGSPSDSEDPKSA